MALISVNDLATQLDDAQLVVCDVRFSLADHAQGRRDYDEAHLPGAVFVDLHTELAGTPGPNGEGGRHPLPTVEEFAALLGRLGIGPSNFVVAYDAAGGATASRLWWMLRSIGHGRVSVLDGGLPAWVAAGHPVTADRTDRPPATYPVPPGWTGVVDAEAVAEGVALGATVVDSRAAERFRGEVEPLDPRAGHIPGAIHRFHGDNVGADGTHLPLDQLAARFAGIGESPVVYCGSGVTACHNLLAMSLVGVSRARLYAGSWSDWSADPDRPVATGDA
ncbi:MAG: sulfurtransferase [Ilumatobacter sp.]|uniref:sulfurtransferase n=1 Tax=Ilumatobacter sp. TaxID=1967498 RepID=UPI002605ACF8|nr:sulfurtransferase [Ilumatobacter sp.]MDJ0767610.1 sulfurtransferase [Ilumatobacter sp.]